jgi:uncharacterized iron-regulated protein
MFFRSLFVTLIVVTVSGPRAAAEILADHPLVDTVLEVATGRTIDQATLESRLQAATFVLLGEKHDNARHHLIQAELVDAMGRAGGLEAVAFEMLPTDRQGALTEHLAFGGTVADLDLAVGWAELGWGPWTWYGPIAFAGDRHGASLVAANLSEAETRAVYRSGPRGLDPRLVRRTGLDEPLGPGEQALREQGMVDAHCGHALGEAAARMVDVQRARDARMAERLATLAGSGQGVLITGNAHADKVRGVPVPLQRLRAGAEVVSVGLIEVRAAWTTLPDEDWPYDYVWFTPRAKAEDHDYCAGMRTAN